MMESIRVLHVDDESSFLELTADFLEAEDDRFEVTSEPSPADGLDRLDAATFDCVVSDYQMPETDGIEFLNAVREAHPSLPFILFTGEGSETVASDAISAGATDYLQKRTGTEQYELLANRIRNAVESHQTQRELEQYELLVETVGDPMYIIDTEGSVTLANTAFAEMLGCDPDTAHGLHADDFLVEGGYESQRERLAEIAADPTAGWSTEEVGVVTTDSRVIPTEINIAPVAADDGRYDASVGVVRDITARKQRERRLEALHATTRKLIDAAGFEAAVEVGITAAEDVLGMEVAGFYAPAPDDADGEGREGGREMEGDGGGGIERDGGGEGGGEMDREGDEVLLVPVATTDRVESLVETVPRIGRGEGVIWNVYESGEPVFTADVRQHPDAYNPETPIRTELLIPAGDHGVFIAGATSVDGFDTTDKELAHILVATLTRALDSSDLEYTEE